MSTELNHLVRNSPLNDVIQTINALIDLRNERDEILGTLAETSLGVKAVFKASDDVFVSGEVYTVTTSGLYQVEMSGHGSSHFLIDNKATGEITENREIHDDYKSPIMLLSEGDKLIFWSSSTPEAEISITVSMVGNMFTLLKTIMSSYTEITEKVDRLLTEYDGANEKIGGLMAKADNILNNHTNQVAALQRDIAQISERIKSLP